MGKQLKMLNSCRSFENANNFYLPHRILINSTKSTVWVGDRYQTRNRRSPISLILLSSIAVYTISWRIMTTIPSFGQKSTVSLNQRPTFRMMSRRIKQMMEDCSLINTQKSRLIGSISKRCRKLWSMSRIEGGRDCVMIKTVTYI